MVLTTFIVQCFKQSVGGIDNRAFGLTNFYKFLNCPRIEKSDETIWPATGIHASETDVHPDSANHNMGHG